MSVFSPSPGFEDIFIIPPAEDSGATLGAAFWALWQLTGVNALARLSADALGRPYGLEEIKAAAESVGSVRLVSESDYIGATVDLIGEGQIVGWFSGRSELGPRALGQRSIVCDPPPSRHAGSAQWAHQTPPGSFRPFAPAILQQSVPDWFETNGAKVKALSCFAYASSRTGRPTKCRPSFTWTAPDDSRPWIAIRTDRSTNWSMRSTAAPVCRCF